MIEHSEQHSDHESESQAAAAHGPLGPEQSLVAIPRMHWSSLDELNGSPEVARLRSEEFYDKPVSYFDATGWSLDKVGKRPGPIMEASGFVELAVKNNGGSDKGLSRRDFLRLSGAAMAFATAGCGLRPAEKIIPFVKADERVIPGVATHYASTLSGGEAVGVVIKTREGRPIKLEGNPDHPLTKGRLDARSQASIFNLYDPDRLTGPIKNTVGGGGEAAIPWVTADDEISKALLAGGDIVLLTGTVHGPAQRRLIAEFLAAFPGSRHVMYDAFNAEAVRNAQEECYGTKALPRYRFDRAEYILLLNADPFGSGYSSLEWQVGFGERRKVRGQKMNKLVSFEPCLTLTGTNADEHFRIRPGDAVKIAIAVAKSILATSTSDITVTGRAEIESLLSRYTVGNIESDAGLPKGTIQRLAKEIAAHKGESIVMAGGDDEALQIVANALNTILGNDGKTVDAVVAPSQQSLGSTADMLALINDMKAGKVAALITFGTNPGYSLPESAGFADGMKRVKTRVSLSDRVDETALWCDYVLPGLHDLESWGDAEPQVGLFGLTQPTIQPLYDNRGWASSLIAFAVAAKAGTLGQYTGDWRAYIAETWTKQIYESGKFEARFENFWNGALRDGVLNTISERDTDPRPFNADALASLNLPQVNRGALELYVYPSPQLADGRDANNAWLIELPDPVSRVSWTNYASMSEVTAKQLGLEESDFINLEAAGKTVEIQTHIQPGDADGLISVHSGWGRRNAGRVADGLGADAFSLREFKNGKLLSSGIACQVAKSSREWVELPCVMGHNSIEGRHILYEASFEEYLKDPHAGQHGHHDLMSMWGGEFEYSGYRWGMTIDLNQCIGCNACIVACQVENNIPVVGRWNLTKGREMHWIRIDRYYSADRDNPETAFEPMLCQHCENAPCETVCPVLATVHDEEGLNMQTYNRCVGTRYCSNNCPYKVRRFNWHEFTFTAYDEHPLELALNPDVTVREKGVMEKCTFCHQRIRESKRRAIELGRKVADADLLTACQQTCPTDAIVFGDVNNPDSLVSRNRKDPRGFHVLEELNVKPSITYMTKLRNRSPRETDIPAGGHDGYHEPKGAHS